MVLTNPSRPTRPPTHRNVFLREKKLIEMAGNLRLISGTQTFFWPLTPPLGVGYFAPWTAHTAKEKATGHNTQQTLESSDNASI